MNPAKSVIHISNLCFLLLLEKLPKEKRTTKLSSSCSLLIHSKYPVGSQLFPLCISTFQFRLFLSFYSVSMDRVGDDPLFIDGVWKVINVIGTGGNVEVHHVQHIDNDEEAASKSASTQNNEFLFSKKWISSFKFSWVLVWLTPDSSTQPFKHYICISTTRKQYTKPHVCGSIDTEQSHCFPCLFFCAFVCLHFTMIIKFSNSTFNRWIKFSFFKQLLRNFHTKLHIISHLYGLYFSSIIQLFCPYICPSFPYDSTDPGNTIIPAQYFLPTFHDEVSVHGLLRTGYQLAEKPWKQFSVRLYFFYANILL